MVGRNAAQAYAGLDLGASVRIGPGTWHVVGFFDANGSAFDSEIWADATVLNGSYQRPPGVFQSVTTRLRSADDFPAFKAMLERDPRVHLQAVREAEYYEAQSRTVTTLITVLGGLVAMVMGLGAVLGALNTMYSAVAERSREIAVLRALGFGGGSVVLAFLAESMWIALIGGVLGCLLALPVNGITTGTINWQTFSHLAFAFRITPDLLALGLGFAVLMGLSAGCRRRSAPPARTCRARCGRCDGRVTAAATDRAADCRVRHVPRATVREPASGAWNPCGCHRPAAGRASPVVTPAAHEECMAALIEAIAIKRKMFFEYDGAPYHCIEVEVSKPTARGGQTLVRLKMRNLLTRAVFDKTFKAGEKFSEPDLVKVSASYQYAGSDGYHFMDDETFETLTLSAGDAGRRSPAARRQHRRADPEVQRRADWPGVPAARGDDGGAHRARHARRHGERQRDEGGDDRHGARDPRPAVHQGRRAGEGPHRDARVRRPRLNGRRSSLPPSGRVSIIDQPFA